MCVNENSARGFPQALLEVGRHVLSRVMGGVLGCVGVPWIAADKPFICVIEGE